MFSFKFHKQLQQLFPLMQQGDEYQTSNKHTSYDQQAEQCNTPNYNTVQDDINSRLDGQTKIIQYQMQLNLQYSSQFDTNAYQKMRQDPKIDYNQLFNNYNIHIIDKNKQTNHINTKLVNKQLYTKDTNYKNINNINKKLKIIAQDQKDINENNENKSAFNQFRIGRHISEVKSIVLDKNDYNNESQMENILINGKPLTTDMIEKDCKLKWRLIEQILMLYKQQQIQNMKLKAKSFGKRTHSYYQDQNKGHTYQISVINAFQFQKVDEDKIQTQFIDDLIQSFGQIQNIVYDFNNTLQEKNQLLSTQFDQVALIVQNQMKKHSQEKQRKQNFIQYKYQKLLEQQFNSFQKTLQQQDSKFQNLIGLKIQQESLKMLKNKRINKQNLYQWQQEIHQECRQLQQDFNNQYKQNQEKIIILSEQIKGSFLCLQKAFICNKVELKDKQFVVKQKIKQLGQKLQILIEDQIRQGHQVENSLIKLIDDLVKNI